MIEATILAQATTPATADAARDRLDEILADYGLAIRTIVRTTGPYDVVAHVAGPPDTIGRAAVDAQQTDEIARTLTLPHATLGDDR